MSTNTRTIRDLTEREYQWGFVTEIGEERVPKGLNEEIIHMISEKKGEPEFMLQWRLKAYRHWAFARKGTGGTEVGQYPVQPDRLSEHRVLFRPAEKAWSAKPGRGRP